MGPMEMGPRGKCGIPRRRTGMPKELRREVGARRDAARPRSVHGTGQEVALAELAAQLLEERELLAGLDAFGDHLLGERLPELEDRLHDLVPLAVALHVLDEGAVDLERVDRQAREVGKARVAGA